MTSEIFPPKRIIADKNVPMHYRKALGDMFRFPMSEERSFIALTWIDRPLSPTNPVPTPLAWILSADRMQQAEQCSAVVRNILDAMFKELRIGEIKPEGFEALRLLLLKRVRLLSVPEAEHIFSDIGVPVMHDADFHELTDVVLMPFATDTGFSDENMALFLGHVPSYVVDFVDCPTCG